MLEIICLFIITRHIGNEALLKGKESRKWKIYSIILFFILEIAGVCAGFLLFSKDNLFSIGLIGIAFGITSYPIIHGYLSKIPDIDNREFE